MGKIQDALEKLREVDQRERHHRPQGSLPESTRHQGGVKQPDERPPLAGESPSFHLKEVIEVEQSKLKEFGLIRDGANADNLLRQFQRIKRPVLNIAFGSIGASIEHSNVIMFASAMPGSGKSFCSVNLARSISRERDYGVVLIDADVRKPNVSRAFGVEDRPGLIDYLLDPNVSLRDIAIGTDLHDIIVVPSGQQHEEATELLASKRMREFVHVVSERFRDYAILVDAPPLLLTNEAQELAARVGQIVLVIEAGASTQESVLKAAEMLNREKPINVILNKARGTSVGYYGSAYKEQRYP
jgi:exopolysaccharide/PEP-CTERM locus tyrosine autokinase